MATVTKNYATHHGRTAGNNGGVAENQLIAHTLRAEGHDASEDGAGRGVPLVAMAANAHGGSGRLDGESETFVPVAFRAAGQERFTPDSISPPVASTDGGGAGVPTMSCGMAVRRLTPREVERLQGFPDDYTLVPYRGKPACDGPRYRALGNSMAVPLVRWLGQRIELVAGVERTRNALSRRAPADA